MERSRVKPGHFLSLHRSMSGRDDEVLQFIQAEPAARIGLARGARPRTNGTNSHMKLPFLFAFTSMLLLSACVGPIQENRSAPTPVAAESSAHNYRCQSGRTIAAAYPSTDSATIEYMGSRYDMHIAISASGSRYIGGGLEWWTKGSGVGSQGSLFRHMSDGTSGPIIELCTEF